jgi:HEAT repeat protein
MSREAHPELPDALETALGELRRGTWSRTHALAFSDLSRHEARGVASAWAEIPEEGRIGALRAMDELSETDLSFNFGRLFRIALNDPSAAVRQVAVAALWEDTGSDLIDTFIRLMEQDVSVDVRGEAASSLGRFATLAVLDELEDATAFRLGESLFRVAADAHEPALVRRRALESVAVYGDAFEISDLIAAALDDDDAAVRSSAIYAMGRSANKRWLPAVINELESEDAEVRYEAARASGELGLADALPALAELTADSDTEVRQAAITAIGKIGGRGAVRILQDVGGMCAAGDRDTVRDALAEASLVTDPLRGPA